MSWYDRSSISGLSSSMSISGKVRARANSSDSSIFERGFAKYRSLSTLWFRACTFPKRRPIIGDRNTILISFNHFGKLPHFTCQLRRRKTY